MANVGVVVRSIQKELGEPSFLHSFFSTISFHLESEDWGTRYPELLNKLYQGKLDHEDSVKVREDLQEIRVAFKKLSTDDIVWDIAKPKEKPDWIIETIPDVNDLSEVFIVPNGNNLFDVLDWALERSTNKKMPVILEMVGTRDPWLEGLNN